MKSSFCLSVSLLLTGCVFGTSNEIRTAEKLLLHFQCNNIETASLSHSVMNSYHEHALSVSKQKATQYLESYKSGDELFKTPLDTVIQQQFEIYQASCQSLGGVQK